MSAAFHEESLCSAIAALEFHKVLQHVAAFAFSTSGAEAIVSLRPLRHLATIQTLLDETSEMRGLLDAGEAVPLSTLPDLRNALKHLQISGRALAVRELIDLATFLAIARRTRSFIAARRERCPRLHEVVQSLTNLQAEEHAVESALSFVDGSVKDSASPTLSRIRKELGHATAEAREKLQSIAKKLASRDMLQESMVTLREGRLVLMLKDEFRHRVEGLIHDESASGKTVFIEPMESVVLNNRIRQLQSAEREEIERILLMLSDRFRQVLPAVSENHARMIQLDVIHAKAQASRVLHANAPQLQTEARLQLLSARHPLLLLRNEGNTAAGKVIPLELELGEQNGQQVFTLIISGPNAGGKTVALKTVGLLAMMALAGLHIPADPDSEIPLFGNFFVDIGDRQSIEDDLSTFTSHMSRLIEILHHAQTSDLVLIDEIGVGTDPEAGAALAVAILRELNARGCLSLVTTHHGALKSFAQNEPGVRNGSMDFDQNSLKPTYHFRAGLPGASYAFEIAARLGLEEKLIAAAREMVGSDKSKIESLLADLQTQLSEQQLRASATQQEELKLREARQRYEEKWAQLKTHEQKFKKEAVAAAEQLLQNANAVLEKAIREVREQNASREVIRTAKENLQSLREQVQAEHQKIIAPVEEEIESTTQPDLQPGMQVKWLKQNALATVLEAPDASNKVLIGIGNMRARVASEELRATAQPVVRSAVALPRASAAGTHRTSEIDLRGLRVDEALAEVDKFLDDALLASWPEVRIIHGKGTGALRKSVMDYLKTHSAVRSFRTAAMGEGDYGVTIVELH
ncbi:endonuclease MutS2 [candidate division KSB1 bacterium]|nr:endonuclease MutS2 [candidate division KSB1 bacterium]